MGETDKNDLQGDLERSGWHVERRTSDDWWAHEVWALTSAWRPVGSPAFLTFLNDPQVATTDAASVWAVAVSAAPFVDRPLSHLLTIRVRPDWPRRMREIDQAVASLRPSDM